ncbi:transposase, partial [Haloferax sp. KTX1]
SYAEWPAYDSTSLYDRSSLAGLKEDIWTVASTWFDHQAHHSVDEFVSHYPVAYVEFGPHVRYSGAIQYEMAQLFRLFLLKELHGWAHETALLTYLTHHPELHEQLDIETVPDQSTLWRSWHERFTTELRETIEA